MDFATALSVTQSLFSALQCSQLKEMCSIMGYKSELEDLSRTVNTVRVVLLDAEAKQEELSHEALVWIEELKDAVYDADDLLDEFVTAAEQKRQLLQGGKFSKEQVRLLFFRLNPLSVANRMSRGVKKIEQKLDAIASDHSKFGLGLDYKPIRRRRDETCSFVNDKIIGREKDVGKIMDMLLDSHVEQDVSILSIVGMGGVGKTALAQLLYNHKMVMKEFPLRLWTCISNEDQTQLDVEAILCKVLGLATGENLGGLPMEMGEVVKSQLRELLASKKYFLVLDDVWTENREEWLKLVGFLMGGQRGSWIVVTTRSRETATIVGNGLIYELQGLSDKSSWRLFQRMAFGEEVEPATCIQHNEVIDIGQEIVKKCANIPLAIRVVGSLLYGQDINKWQLLQETGLANMRATQDGIMPILKLSYHNLESPLKSCFSYCALFPKDFEIKKEMLVCLWMSQGYIEPLDDGQSIEAASEEYFQILLRRCFFHDVEKDEFGEIISCKIHDLMHDVAHQVAGNEIFVQNPYIGHMNKKVRHVSFGEYAQYNFIEAHVRTYLYVGPRHGSRMHYIFKEALLVKLVSIRTLDLSYAGIESVSDCIGKLLHLRYLDLSYNKIDLLPKSITKLCNLQTLILRSCSRLKELPKDLSKLVNLRVLDTKYCDSLTYMPLEMGQLTCLNTLTRFVVGEANPCLTQSVHLEDLKALKKLKGDIEILIHFPASGTDVKDNGIRGGEYLTSKEHLREVAIRCSHEEGNRGASYYEEALVEELKPHSNIKGFSLEGYQGVSMPSWARDDNLATFLPYLVMLDLKNCTGLESLPKLGRLPHLKRLYLQQLWKLEYVENDGPTAAGELSFFPCLEELSLDEMPKLKGWWKSEVGVDDDDRSLVESSIEDPHQSPSSSRSFSYLKLLRVIHCPKMTSLPSCPFMEVLFLLRFNERLKNIITSNRMDGEERGEATSSSSSSSSSLPTSTQKLRYLNVDNVVVFNSLPKEAFQCLTSFSIYGDKKVESLSEVEQIFRGCSSSLHTLSIRFCSKLKSISGGIQHLSALETLVLCDIPIQSLADEDKEGKDDDDEYLPTSWRSLQHTLQTLIITYCKELRSLPQWMRKLTSLRHLEVVRCSENLHKRCESPTGEDWPNIQHIPRIDIN